MGRNRIVIHVVSKYEIRFGSERNNFSSPNDNGTARRVENMLYSQCACIRYRATPPSPSDGYRTCFPRPARTCILYEFARSATRACRPPKQ